MERHNNGFLYVGSLSKVYYDAAVMSGESIKDYWPEANLTLFTHKKWVDDNPKFAIAVVIENGESGGRTAGPVAKEILEVLTIEN